MSSEVEKQTDKKLCMRCHGEFSADLTTCPADGTTLTVLSTDPLVGTTFGDKYEILGTIGGGGMGAVYRAKHLLMKRIVAIKVLHNSHATSINAIKRFQIEAQAASALSMPNITTVYDFGTAPTGQQFMVMDYLEGRSLKEIIDDEGRLSVRRAVHIFIQMSKALGHAHDKGIIHRDVKPSNIVLINLDGDPDFVKLVDFGIAKLLNPADSESGNLTRTGEVFGSALYMSPEQCRGQKLDARTDIYSLGAVMYFALMGKPMFEDNDVLRLVFKHVMETPASFKSAGIDVPDELEAMVFKSLAKDPNSRYQSMQELTVALQQFEASLIGSGQPSQQTAPSGTLTVPVPAPVSSPMPVPTVAPTDEQSAQQTASAAPIETRTVPISVPSVAPIDTGTVPVSVPSMAPVAVQTAQPLPAPNTVPIALASERGNTESAIPPQPASLSTQTAWGDNRQRIIYGTAAVVVLIIGSSVSFVAFNNSRQDSQPTVMPSIPATRVSAPVPKIEPPNRQASDSEGLMPMTPASSLQEPQTPKHKQKHAAHEKETAHSASSQPRGTTGGTRQPSGQTAASQKPHTIVKFKNALKNFFRKL